MRFAEELRKALKEEKEAKQTLEKKEKEKREQELLEFIERQKAKLPEVLVEIKKYCKKNLKNKKVIIDSEQNWLSELNLSSAVKYILKEDVGFEKVREFGISNGFKVIAVKETEIGRNYIVSDYNSDGYPRYKDCGPLYGPRITFQW